MSCNASREQYSSSTGATGPVAQLLIRYARAVATGAVRLCTRSAQLKEDHDTRHAKGMTTAQNIALWGTDSRVGTDHVVRKPHWRCARARATRPRRRLARVALCRAAAGARGLDRAGNGSAASDGVGWGIETALLQWRRCRRGGTPPWRRRSPVGARLQTATHHVEAPHGRVVALPSVSKPRDIVRTQRLSRQSAAR